MLSAPASHTAESEYTVNAFDRNDRSIMEFSFGIDMAQGDRLSLTLSLALSLLRNIRKIIPAFGEFMIMDKRRTLRHY